MTCVNLKIIITSASDNSVSLNVNETKLLSLHSPSWLDSTSQTERRHSGEHKQVILYSPAAAVHNTPKLSVRINKCPCQACEI